LAVITVDQVISGASNVVIAILAARLLTAAQFGLFGIVFLVYTVLVWVTRGMVSDTLLVQTAASRERPGQAIGTAFVLAILLATGLGAIAVGIRFWDQMLGEALLALAVCLPLLVIQDVGRYLGFATERPMRAVVLDAVWLGAMVGAVAALFVTGTHSLTWLVAAWAGSGAVAGLVVLVWHRVHEIRLDLGWVKETWEMSWRLVASYAGMQISALGMSSEVGVLAGARALGGVQGTLLLVRPFTTFQVAATTHWMGEVARSGGRRRIWRHALAGSTVAAAVAAANLAVMLLLPNRIGETLLGASWHPAKPLLLPAAVQIVILGLLTGPQAGLLGLRAMSKTLAIGMTTTAISVIAAGAGAALGGAKGALWLVDAGLAIVLGIWWATFAAHLRHVRPAGAAPVPAVAAPAAGLAPGAGRRGAPADIVPTSSV
jgi:O-antigen/teichoic acid export membrane protein